MSPRLIAPTEAPGTPGISNIGSPPLPLACISISISLSSSSFARSLRRKLSRVVALARRADERVEHPLLGGEMRLRLDLRGASRP